ncbi:MAG TPA: hypothetical protein VLV18_03270, partial [Terriglobales bacterium]|nr:hypothetical protein [Terriglobales bacterium]
MIRRLVSPTSKVRRLGYFVGLCKFFTTGGRPASGNLATTLLHWAKDNAHFLETYSEDLPVNRKQGSHVVGAISSKKGADRYLDTAKEMDLVTLLGRQWQTTKTGHLLNVVPASPNPFGLSAAQRFILFDVIRNFDYLYLRTLVRLILEQDPLTDPLLFKKELISQVNEIAKTATTSEELIDCNNVRRNIENWKDLDRYFKEQIKGPRLEWLVDLGLLTRWNQRANYITLRKGVANFFSRPDADDKYLDETYAS